MYLTPLEERILNGEEGPAKAMALEIIVKVGEALGADRLIGINHAHLSGISYGTIGEHGTSLLEELVSNGGKVSVPTTVNPVGFDTEEPGLLGRIGAIIDKDFIIGQQRILRALKSLGANLTLTCTPYYIPRVASLKPGTHVAWGESNAILYANSILGLRTNREGGPLALMAAIAGKTYYWGMHISTNRIPTGSYIVNTGKPLDEVKAGVLGEYIAKTWGTRINPPLINARFEGELAIREFLAAIGAAGSLAMVHINGITPEKIPEKIIGEKILVEDSDLEILLDKYRPTEPPEIIFIGCPHAKAEDLVKIAGKISSIDNIKSKIIITMSKFELNRAKKLYPQAIGNLKRKGVIIARDTCLIVAPFHANKLKIATNSYKALFYLSKRGHKVSLATLEELIRLASSN